MTHREKCEQLKALRKEMADKVGVDLHQTVCTYEGECSGTCPKCAKEESILNKILLSSKLALAGVAMGATALTGCGTNNLDEADNPKDEYLQRRADRAEEKGGGDDLAGATTIDDGYELSGDVEYIPPVDDYDGGLIYDPDSDPDYQLEGEAMPGDIGDETLIEAAVAYTGAAFAEIDHFDGDYAIIYCYDTAAGDTEPALLDILTIERFYGTGTDSAGNGFTVWDVLYDEDEDI